MTLPQIRQIGPRTILTDGGEPMLAALTMRPSTTAPGRIKAMLVMPVEFDGNEGLMPLPFAEPTVAAPGDEPTGFTPEFRLEMN